MVNRRPQAKRPARADSTPWRWLAGVLAVGAGAPGMPAGEARGARPAGWEPLIAASPFRAPGEAATAAPAPPARLEFRGMVTMEGQTFFRIEDLTRNRGAWLVPGQSEDGLQLKTHDPAEATVTVEFHGQSLVLPWCAGKVRDTTPPADMPAVGVDLVPPRYIRNGLRNQSLRREEVGPEHRDNEWFREFVRQYGPPVFTDDKK